MHGKLETLNLDTELLLVHWKREGDVLQVPYLMEELLFFLLNEIVIFFVKGEQEWHADEWAIGRGNDDIPSIQIQILHIELKISPRIVC